jgi:uncharacterized protein
VKKYFLALISLALILGMVGLAGCGGPCQTSTQQQGIVVTGEGKVSVTPDLAVLNLGVSAQSENVAEAQSKAAGAMNKVMAALTGAGIAEKDIQTQRFSITQVTKWEDKSQEQIIIGYRVDNAVNVKIRALDKVGTIVDAVGAAGGDLTRVQGISFTLENPTQAKTDARQKAVADARAKAVQLAEQFDVKLGRLNFVTETQSYVPMTRSSSYDSVAGASLETSISAGELDITVNVQATYNIG